MSELNNSKSFVSLIYTTFSPKSKSVKFSITMLYIMAFVGEILQNYISDDFITTTYIIS